MATYTVKSGDSLSAIAKQYNVPTSSISGYKSGNPNLIYPGETLTIGGASPSPTSAAPPMSNLNQVSSYLNGVQNKAYAGYSNSSFDRGKNEGYIGATKYTDYNEYLRAGGMNMDELNKTRDSMPKVDSIESITANVQKLLPTDAPTTPSLLDTYTKKREELGLEGLEQAMGSLQAEENDIVAMTRQRTQAEQGKPVATGVIAGRVSETERQQNERLDYIVRAKSQLNDQIKTAYGMIDTIINLTAKDYQMAKEEYDSKFNQVMQTMNLVRGIRSDQVDEYYQAQDVALANLTVYANLIKEGNLNVNSLSGDQQLMINKLEVQSGLGVGFLGSVQQKIDPKADIISINSYQGETQVLYKKPDGSIGVETFGARGGSGSATGADNRFNSAILGAASKVDQTYVTIGGKLVSEGRDSDDNKISYKNAGDKLLSEQEYERVVSDAWATVGTKGGYKGSYEDFRGIVAGSLGEAGYNLWTPKK